MKAVISNRIYLNRTKELHDKLLQKLTYSLPPGIPGGPRIEECEVTRVNKDILTIPVGRVDLIPDRYEIVDKRTLAPITFPDFTFTLREDQQEVYDKVEDSCLIIANPGWGKTFTALAIATKLKQKTLIIVHTKMLLNQWINEVKKTLRFEPGKIGAGELSNLDAPIVIGMKQTIENKINLVKDNFGLVIVDECHHIPAKVFKEVIDKFKCRYKIGLTATPWRKDGRHVLLKDYLGLKELKPIDTNRMDPKIFLVETDIKLNIGYKTPWATKLNEIYTSPDYIELITNLSHIQAKRGFKVLTVADRIEFLEDCSHILENFMLIIGKTTNRNFINSNKDGILGTQKIFAEGVNIPILGSLIMATPINNRSLLEQLLGRISRKVPNKPTPEVIDIAFSGNTGKNQMVQRLNFYAEQGLKVKRI